MKRNFLSISIIIVIALLNIANAYSSSTNVRDIVRTDFEHNQRPSLRDVVRGCQLGQPFSRANCEAFQRCCSGCSPSNITRGCPSNCQNTKIYNDCSPQGIAAHEAEQKKQYKKALEALDTVRQMRR